MLTKHFVEFFSPGTFVAETSIRPIESWDIATALKMACDINERYNATPYGFRFLTKSRGDDDLDSREVARSSMHYFGVRVLTRADIEARNDPKDTILLDNMRCNKWDRVVETTNGYKATLPLQDGDIVLSEVTGQPMAL